MRSSLAGMPHNLQQPKHPMSTFSGTQKGYGRPPCSTTSRTTWQASRSKETLPINQLPVTTRKRLTEGCQKDEPMAVCDPKMLAAWALHWRVGTRAPETEGLTRAKGRREQGAPGITGYNRRIAGRDVPTTEETKPLATS
ncbi:uncharacterized protein LOC143672770 [Tamandua tetradactyla]|uniref:uncharacterized protein LOC143672770 n=1 Tax=Tamandua tetradactyla TaxID=48850 RepID=UPI0040546671